MQQMAGTGQGRAGMAGMSRDGQGRDLPSSLSPSQPPPHIVQPRTSRPSSDPPPPGSPPGVLRPVTTSSATWEPDRLLLGKRRECFHGPVARGWVPTWTGISLPDTRGGRGSRRGVWRTGAASPSLLSRGAGPRPAVPTALLRCQGHGLGRRLLCGVCATAYGTSCLWRIRERRASDRGVTGP